MRWYRRFESYKVYSTLLTILKITLNNLKKRKQLYVVRRHQMVERSGSLFQHCNTHRFYRISFTTSCTVFALLFWSYRLPFLRQRSQVKIKQATLTSYRRVNIRRATNIRHDRHDRHNCPKIANVWKNVNVHADLRFATITRLLNPALPTRPNPKYVTKFKRQLHADARSFDAPTVRRDTTGRGQGQARFKLRSNLC